MRAESLLVVGGGIAGLTAAVEAAETGREVYLVEREPYLGGRVARMNRYFPKLCPPYCGLEIQFRRIRGNPAVHVLTLAEVEEIRGGPGDYEVRVRLAPRYVDEERCTACGACVPVCPVDRPDDFNYGMGTTKAIHLPHALAMPMKYVIDGDACRGSACGACAEACPYGAVDLAMRARTITLRVGAVTLATGWRPYAAERLEHLGHGRSANVMTSVAFEEMARTGRLIRPSDGRAARRVAFIQCAGSRDPDHLPYCSSFCCAVSLKQALYVREHDRDAQAFIFYRDLRAAGTAELFYRRVQEDEGIFLAKGEVTAVNEDAEGNVVVEATDTLLGERVALTVDLAVLAVGAVPATAEEAAVNLRYRQGPALPTDRYGFPDSNFICFPYETRRTGIYAAGCVRQPMDAGAAAEDGAGAALKAIQSVRMAARGAAVHPRSGDLSFPRFFLQSCTQCKRCTEECPFGALDDDERGTPKLNPSRCRRCGTCMGACPQRIISFDDYSVEQLSAAVKAIPIPDDPGRPRILAFACENDAYPAFDMAGFQRLELDASVRVIPVRCLGSLNVVLIADAFSRGIDGILLIGCRSGDDYQCHFVRGSELAERRLANVQETLDRLMIERERVRLVHLAISDCDRLPALTAGFAAEMKRLGPNPYKGF